MGTVATKDVARLMPLTAQWVKGLRARWGNEHVTDQQKRAMAGERNRFYAIEAGHQFGTAFDWTDKGAYLCNSTLLSGATFLAAMREPDDTVHLTVGMPHAKGQKHGAD